ncbi:hypothetical protein J2N86_04970 [Legionella lytica]|uniref:Uncharacterized protein n=1 Tax=Legionella lytica TaxID=96232 RepID=A0ABY4YAZ0_9GAMM|nr:hypothetical protein [Legionella lytica]USQ14659.1 hypothetical protein J2N86_04970 [Legionella lytica]
MAKQPPQSNVDNLHAPVDTAGKAGRLYNNTQLGSPIDTVEEFDAQLHNLGPLDSKTEVAGLDHDEPEQRSTNKPR